MGVDTGGRNDIRQRRAFQKLAADAIGTLKLIEGFGIIFDGDTINVALRATDPGLSLTGGLGVLLNATDPGLSLTGGLALAVAAGAPFGLTGGLNLSLASAGGLKVDAAELGVKLDTNPGLVLGAGGLAVDLDTDPGLALGAGGLSVDVGASSPITKSGGLDVALKSTGGLETVTNQLGIKLVSGGELEVGASGLDHAYPPGRFADIDARTTAASLVQVPAGQLVLIDSAYGTSQGIRLPDPATCPGEHVTVKMVGTSPVAFIISAQYLNDYTGLIEGIPANGSGTSFVTVTLTNGSYTVTSDGVGWWFTSVYSAFQDVMWQRYEIKYGDITNKSGVTGEITLFSFTPDILNSVVFERCYAHIRQGWFTSHSGICTLDVTVDDANSATTRNLLTGFQMWPATVTGNTGRSPMSEVDIISTGTITVKAKFTVSGGSSDINDVAQGRSTIWIQWGNIGPAFL